jgi:hypothetical protein
MSGELTLDVYVSDYKPIPGDPAVMRDGQATWPASSVSLVSGGRDAVLIDAQALDGNVIDARLTTTSPSSSVAPGSTSSTSTKPSGPVRRGRSSSGGCCPPTATAATLTPCGQLLPRPSVPAMTRAAPD